MTRIITVRHAATDYSQQKRIAGKLDVPISVEGVAQAKMLRDYMDRIDRDTVISSSLGRALQTAQLCTGLPAGDIEVRNDCTERDFGKLQGLSPNEVAEINSEVEYVKVGEHHHSINPPGGETLDALRHRAEKFRDYALEHHEKRSVMIFSHHTFLQQFHGTLAGQDTFECLARDIKFLEVNFFDLDSAGNLIKHSFERPVVDDHDSW